jgi:hypothetical protein
LFSRHLRMGHRTCRLKEHLSELLLLSTELGVK